jgi:broad specificity phosphatase PhoE
MYKLFFITLLFMLASCSNTYYIVRHAEKEAQAQNMTSDVELTIDGRARAESLKSILSDKKITTIFSTNFKRTKSTARPLSEATGIAITDYDSRDSGFIDKLKNLKKNVLVVGHSNTVDDILNGLIGEARLTDLADTRYGDLFIVTRKGNKFYLEQSRFGK